MSEKDYGTTKAGRPKKKPGRKTIYDEPMEGSFVIKLPRWQVQYLENGVGPRGRSKHLRSILERFLSMEGDFVLPADPGPGVTARHSYKIPPSYLEAIKRYGRGKGYTVALRRILTAEIAGQIPSAKSPK